MSSLTPLYVPKSRPSPRPPEERRSEQPVLYRHQAAAIDVERSKLNEERAPFERERAEFERRAAAAQPPAPEQIRPVEPKRRVDAIPIHKPDVPPTDAKALAARIVEMGRVRRSEIPYRGTEPTLPMAKAIIAAAAKARSTAAPPELPENLTARAIVLSGQKGRGTIDSVGARWLADYFARAEAIRGLMP